MDDTERIGQRIAKLRKAADLTQQQLADMAKISKSMLSKVEQGKAAFSNAGVGAVARALHVDVSALTGQPYVDGNTDNQAAHKYIPVVRQMLAAWDLIEVPTDVPLEDYDRLTRRVNKLHEWRHGTNYAKIGQTLPEVLPQLIAVAQAADEDLTRAWAFTNLTKAYRAANTMAHKLGYADLSLTALERMKWAAGHTGDPLLVALVDYVRAGSLSRLGDSAAAVRLLTRAMQSIEQDPGEDARAVMGCLHMKLIAIYGSMNQRDLVDLHTEEARQIAAHGSGDRMVYDTPFGPTNIELHALNAAVDLGDPEKATRIASETRLPDDYARERRTYFWIDSARAYLLNCEPDKAVEALYEAHAASPIKFRNSTLVRNTVLSLAEQQRTAGRGLRALANQAGIRD